MSSFGFIGTGNMGSALATAASKALPGNQLMLANRTPAKAEALASELKCTFSDNRTIAAKADYIFLAVKPQMMKDMLASIADILSSRESRFILVTMAPGLTMQKICEFVGRSCPVIRIMPNTPASIGSGMILYCRNEMVSDDEVSYFLHTMSAAGRLSPIAEHLIDAGSAVSGCGPAFVDLFIEALADGGVACGLPRAAALEYAAQMVMGSAQLVLQSGKHPGVLKDAVCSPGGSTIQGVRILEENGFRAAVMDAVIAAYKRSVVLG